MPVPSATTLGGVESLTAVAHNWINAISTLGVPSAAQPASADLSDAPSVVTPSSANTFTNKTLDAEATGNVVTFPVKAYIALASCPDGANASLAVDAALAQTVACFGTNTKTGVWQAADADAVTFGIELPTDWTGAIDAEIDFNSPDTTGTVIFNVATACVSTTGATADDPTFNAASALSTITLAAPANASWKSSVTGITATGCAAGGWVNFKVSRATDTATSRVNVKGVQLTMRRAM